MLGFPKHVRWQSKKYRDAAKGETCKMNIPDVCDNNQETVVLAHDNGGGMGTKKSDHNAADMCAKCHDEWDGRTHINRRNEYDLEFYFAEARLKTIINRLECGILK